MAYPDIVKWIRRCLQDSVATLADSEFDLDIESAIDRLLDPYPDQTYDGLSATDQKWMNEAAGLMAAARLQIPMTTGGNALPLTLEQTNGSMRQFAQPGGDLSIDERKRWLQESQSAYAKLSFVKAETAANPPRAFAAAGRRRSEGAPRNVIELAFGRTLQQIQDAFVLYDYQESDLI